MKKIATVQSIHTGEVAAIMLTAALAAIECPIEHSNDLVISVDKLAKTATLECNCNELTAWFKHRGQARLRTTLGEMCGQHVINGYLTHPILTEEIDNYKQIISVCITFKTR